MTAQDQQSRAELLPCAHCGSSRAAIHNQDPDHLSGGYYIECQDCGASTGLRFACSEDPKPLLVEQWNRRANDENNEQLRAQAAKEAEAKADWRRLALQFDGHRMQALTHLRLLVLTDKGYPEAKDAEQFLAAPPLNGEKVLAERIAELAAGAAPVRHPLSALEAIKLGMQADDETRKHCRGTTNWAAAITRFYERAHGITAGGSNG